MVLHQITERQAVLPNAVPSGEQDKSLGDMFSDLLQKITGAGAASAVASHAIGIEGLPTLHVAPLEEQEVVIEQSQQEEATVEEASPEAVSEDDSTELSDEELQDAALVAPAAAKELTTTRTDDPEIKQEAVATEGGERATVSTAATGSEKFQLAQATTEQVVDTARAQVTADASPQAAAPLATPAVLAEDGSPELAPERAKLDRAPASQPGAAIATAELADDAPLMSAPPTAPTPKGNYSASPAAEYTRLQMILSNGGAATHADSAALRSVLGNDVSAKTVSAISGSGDSVMQSVDKAKAVSRVSPAQQAKTIERIQQILDQAIRGRDLNTIIVNLDPQDLGKLSVKLTQRGDQLFARIKPENPEVENLLKQKLPEITGVLAQSGLKLDNVHVTVGSERSETESFGFQDLLGRNSTQGGSHQSDSQNSGNGPARGRDLFSPDVVTNAGAQQGYAEMESAWIA